MSEAIQSWQPEEDLTSRFIHSVESDSADTLDLMLQEARALGYVTAEALATAIAASDYEEDQISSYLQSLDELEIEVVRPPTELQERAEDAAIYKDAERQGASISTMLDYAGSLHLLSPDEELELGRLAQAGDKDARNALVEHNIRLTIEPANKRRNRGLEMDDLVGGAIGGLMRAADKFDPAYGNRFSTYAMFWIKQSTDREIVAAAKTISETPEVRQARVMMSAIEQRLNQELERVPTFDEIFAETSYSREMAEAAWYPTEVTASLDAQLGDDLDSATAYDIQADANAVMPDEEVRQNEIKTALYATIEELRQVGELSDQQVQILAYKHGLLGAPELTNPEACQKLGIGEKTYRTLLKKAMESLEGRQELRAVTQDSELFEPISTKPAEKASLKIEHGEASVEVTPTQLKILEGVQRNEPFSAIAKSVGMKKSTTKNFSDRIRRQLDLDSKQALIAALTSAKYTPIEAKT